MKKTAIHLLIIAVLGLIIYSNALHVPFHFDDNWSIVENPEIKDLEGYFGKFGRHRYMAYLSFAVNYRIHGLDTTGYHVVNIAVHIANSILVYFLIRLIFKTPALREKGRSNVAVALFAGLLFVSHPVQTQAVTYIVQRLTSLAAMFYLLSISLYIKWRLTSLASPIRARRGRAFYFLSFLFAVFAMKTKEISFTLPLLITLCEFMFFEGESKKKLLYVLPFLLTMSIIPLSLMGLDKPVWELISDVGDATRVQTAMSRWEYLFTEFRVMLTYIRLLFVPVNQNLYYDYPVYRSFLDAGVFISFIFVMLSIAFAVYLYARAGSRAGDAEGGGYRLFSFGIFWFFITLLPESSLIPIADVINEHRLYLPSAGAFIMAVTAAFLFVDNIKFKNVMTAPLVAAIVVFSIASHERNKVWQSGISLWEDAVKKSPRKARAHYNLATSYAEEGYIEKAIGHFNTSIELNPYDERAHYNLALALHRSGLPGKAAYHYEEALRLNPDYREARNNLGIAYYESGQKDKAVAFYMTALKAKEDAASHYNLGLIYQSEGMMDEALKEYLTAIRINRGFKEAWNNAASIYRSKGMTDKAIEHYQAVLLFSPMSAETHLNLAAAFKEKGFINAALLHFERARKLNPAMMNLPGAESGATP